MRSSLIAIATIVISGGCGLAPIEERCNSDVECASRACILGACRDRADDARVDPRVDAVIEEPADSSEPIDDPIDEIECTPSTGFVVFDDLDLDGHGAGPSRCAFDVGVGVAEIGDDCNDDDATVFALTTVYDDVDGDGFTNGARLACISESAPPPGVRVVRADAPVHAVEPRWSAPLDGDWQGRVFDPRAAAPVGVLELGDFACAASLDRVSGIEVRVLVEDLVFDSARPVGVGLQVEAPDGTLSEPFFTFTDIEGTASFTHGGAGDLLGFAGLTPELVCNPDLAVRVTIDGGDALTSLFFVEAELAFFGVDDCDDTLDEAFSPATLLSDDDGDQVGAGAPFAECVGGEIPYGRAVRDDDCAPADARAFPGQTGMFVTPREGVGGFDFNCDNQIEHKDDSVPRLVENSCSFDGSFCNWSQNHVNPGCGASVPVFGYCQAGCNLDTFTQRCR